MNKSEKETMVSRTVSIDLIECGAGGVIKCGFKYEWLTAVDSNKGVEVSLFSGAGYGSPWMTLQIEKEGEDPRYFRADMRDFVSAVVPILLGEHDDQRNN